MFFFLSNSLESYQQSRQIHNQTQIKSKIINENKKHKIYGCKQHTIDYLKMLNKTKKKENKFVFYFEYELKKGQIHSVQLVKIFHRKFIDLVLLSIIHFLLSRNFKITNEKKIFIFSVVSQHFRIFSLNSVNFNKFRAKPKLRFHFKQKIELSLKKNNNNKRKIKLENEKRATVNQSNFNRFLLLSVNSTRKLFHIQKFTFTWK